MCRHRSPGMQSQQSEQEIRFPQRPDCSFARPASLEVDLMQTPNVSQNLSCMTPSSSNTMQTAFSSPTEVRLSSTGLPSQWHDSPHMKAWLKPASAVVRLHNTSSQTAWTDREIARWVANWSEPPPKDTNTIGGSYDSTSALEAPPAEAHVGKLENDWSQLLLPPSPLAAKSMSHCALARSQPIPVPVYRSEGGNRCPGQGGMYRHSGTEPPSKRPAQDMHSGLLLQVNHRVPAGVYRSRPLAWSRTHSAPELTQLESAGAYNTERVAGNAHSVPDTFRNVPVPNNEQDSELRLLLPVQQAPRQVHSAPQRQSAWRREDELAERERLSHATVCTEGPGLHASDLIPVKLQRPENGDVQPFWVPYGGSVQGGINCESSAGEGFKSDTKPQAEKSKLSRATCGE